MPPNWTIDPNYIVNTMTNTTTIQYQINDGNWQIVPVTPATQDVVSHWHEVECPACQNRTLNEVAGACPCGYKDVAFA